MPGLSFDGSGLSVAMVLLRLLVRRDCMLAAGQGIPVDVAGYEFARLVFFEGAEMLLNQLGFSIIGKVG